MAINVNAGHWERRIPVMTLEFPQSRRLPDGELDQRIPGITFPLNFDIDCQRAILEVVPLRLVNRLQVPGHLYVRVLQQPLLTQSELHRHRPVDHASHGGQLPRVGALLGAGGGGGFVIQCNGLTVIGLGGAVLEGFDRTILPGLVR